MLGDNALRGTSLFHRLYILLTITSFLTGESHRNAFEASPTWGQTYHGTKAQSTERMGAYQWIANPAKVFPVRVAPMIVITENESAAVVNHELAYGAMKAALIAMSEPDAAIFPVARGHGTNPQNRFGVKAGVAQELAGLKVGSYFPTNDAVGLARHGSIVLLFDQARGRIGAVVEGSLANAYRTAGADAVATDLLARPNAKVLTVFGTGHQAEYEVTALSRIRAFETVLVVGRSSERSNAFIERLTNQGVTAEASTAEAACRAADVIVTATTSTAPLFEAEWVRPGTHISAMGADSAGKHELPQELYERAALFCDLPTQSRVLGEFQHVPTSKELTAIGDVLKGVAGGRKDTDEITAFDSSGVSIQDLFMARAIIEAAGVEAFPGHVQ